MRPSHGLLAALAVTAVIGGLLLWARDASERPPAQAPTESATAPLASPSVAMPAPALAAASSAPRPVATPALNATPAATVARVGSEGYGPHIDRAQVGLDAAAAWEAVQWLRLCASNEARRHSAETARSQGVAPDMLTQLMVEADAEARRCQTVTALHRTLLPELAARALRAGLPDAASAYASAAFAADLTPAQRQQVADAIRRDASQGHPNSLLACLTAYAELPGEPQARDRVRQLIEQQRIRFKAVPTPEQQAAARLAADQILARVRAGQPS